MSGKDLFYNNIQLNILPFFTDSEVEVEKVQGRVSLVFWSMCYSCLYFFLRLDFRNTFYEVKRLQAIG